MDTDTLISQAKARFNHNSAKTQLKDKYDIKLVIADQGGLWKADSQTISLLSAFTTDTLVLIDTFQNPVKVDRKKLLETLTNLYSSVMEEYNNEWLELEKKR